MTKSNKILRLGMIILLFVLSIGLIACGGGDPNEKAAVAVDETIALIPDTLTLEDEDLVQAAINAYARLSIDQKALVEDYDVLLLKIENLQDLKDAPFVEVVDDLIAALPATVTLADRAAVVAAREAYDALTERQQNLVSRIDLFEIKEDLVEDLRIAAMKTVTFDVDGGSNVAAQDVDDATVATEPEDPTKTGYTFAGWYTEDTLTTEFDFETVITADITLYAKWTANDYTVTFDVDGGSNVVALEVEYNTAATAPTAPTKAGFTFEGWYTEEALTTEFDFTTVITADITLYAKWALEVYTVSFDENGGVAIANQNITRNEVATEPTDDPTKTGYDFAGWFSDDALTTAFDFTTAITADTTIYAKWEMDLVNFRNVEFDLNGGDWSITNIKAAGDPLKSFDLGYYNATGAQYNTDHKTSIFLQDNGVLTTSKWVHRIGMNKNSDGLYEIMNILLSGVEGSMADYEFVLVSHDGFPAGHTFLGSLVVGQIITVSGFETTTVGAIEGTVKVYPNGTDMATETLFEKDATLPVPTKEDYVFLGWFDNSSFTGDALTTATITGKLHAKWVDAEQTVSFNVDGGTNVINQKVDYNTSATQPADPTKDGYIFKGWFAEAAFTNAFDFDSKITATTTIYAKWELIIVADVDYAAVWNEVRGTWYIKVSVPNELLDATTVKSIEAFRKAGLDITPVTLTPDTDTVLWFGVAERDADLSIKDSGVYAYKVVKQDDSEYYFSFDYNPESVTVVPELFDTTVDYAAVLNESRGTYYIKVSLSELLDATTIKSITVIKSAGEYVTPVTLTPDTDTVLWFGVADDNGVPLKLAGEYAYEVVRQDDSLYIFKFDYNPASVTDLPALPEATVDYGAEWNETRGTWYIEVSYTEFLDAATIKSISVYKQAGLYITPIELTPDTDKVLWFSVALANGDLGIKDAGEYMYVVTRLDDSKYAFTFDYDPTSVTNVTHAVSFDTNEGSAVDTLVVEKGTNATAPATDPTKDGYTFDGWYADEDLTTEFDFTANITEDTTVYAKWAVVDYTITYNYNDGVALYASQEAMFIAFLTDLYAYVDPTETLEEFMHGTDKTTGFDGLWHSNATYKAKIYGGPKPTAADDSQNLFISSTAYYEKWLPFFDTVQLFVKAVNSGQNFYDDTFVGFIRIRQYIIQTKPAASVTDATMSMVPANFVEIPTYTIESADLVLPTPVKENQQFRGWFTTSDLSGTPFNTIPTGTFGNLELYAKWSDPLLYETGFEDVAKAAYAAADVTIGTIDWNLDNALIGKIDGDKKVGTWSLRAKAPASATMLSGLDNVTKLSFQYANYGSNDGATLEVQISKDGATWVTIMVPTTATADLQEVSLVIDYTNSDLVTAGITATSNVRFQFVFSGTDDDRINIDEVNIY